MVKIDPVFSLGVDLSAASRQPPSVWSASGMLSAPADVAGQDYFATGFELNRRSNNSFRNLLRP